MQGGRRVRSFDQGRPQAVSRRVVRPTSGDASVGAGDEHGHVQAVPDPVDGLAEAAGRGPCRARASRRPAGRPGRAGDGLTSSPAGSGPCSKTDRTVYPRSLEGFDQVGQVALVGLGFAVGRLRAQDARHRRVDDVQQDQLARCGLAFGRGSRPGSGSRRRPGCARAPRRSGPAGAAAATLPS